MRRLAGENTEGAWGNLREAGTVAKVCEAVEEEKAGGQHCNRSWLCLGRGASVLRHLKKEQKEAFPKPSVQVGPVRSFHGTAVFPNTPCLAGATAPNRNS